MQRSTSGLNNFSDAYTDMEPAINAREERRLMRQRGAGNRDFDNIDFGFAFATPTQLSIRKSRSGSRTPTISARTPLRASNGNRSGPLSSARSTTTQQKSAIVEPEANAASASHTRRKRRRLSDISNISRSTDQSVLPVPEDGHLEKPENNHLRSSTSKPRNTHEQAHPDSYRRLSSSPLFFPDPPGETIDANKENEPVRNVAKKRKRKSIGQQSLSRKKRSSGSSITSSHAALTVDESTNQVPLQSGHQDMNSIDGSIAQPDLVTKGISSVLPPATQSHQTAAPTGSTAPTRRKKRKSITGPKKRRKSTGTIPQVVEDPTLTGESERHQTPLSTIDDNQDSIQNPHRRQPRKRSDMIRQSLPVPTNEPVQTPRASIRDEEIEDETYMPDEATPEPTPAPKRVKGRPVARQRSRAEDVSRSTAARRKNGKFPILTHRMANIHSLPTIIEDVGLNMSHGDNEEADELAGHPPAILTKPAPNAVDVLAQACRETIVASLEGLDVLSSAERSRQTLALQNFRSNLDIRLFDLSQSLDQRLHLEARLRKQRREKAELQARWLEVRKQRDHMALRMDAARRQHWENEIVSRQAWHVSQLAHRLETAVGRAEDQADQDTKAASLDFSLRELGQAVSSKDGGGILNVLRNFNAQLERTARMAG